MQLRLKGKSNALFVLNPSKISNHSAAISSTALQKVNSLQLPDPLHLKVLFRLLSLHLENYQQSQPIPKISYNVLIAGPNIGLNKCTSDISIISKLVKYQHTLSNEQKKYEQRTRKFFLKTRKIFSFPTLINVRPAKKLSKAKEGLQCTKGTIAKLQKILTMAGKPSSQTRTPIL